MYFDIGANLAQESLAADLEAVLQRARAAGVKKIAVTGSDIPSSRASIEFSRRYPGFLIATAGLHPHLADSFDTRCRTQLTEWGHLTEVRAIGESGLDYFRNLSARDRQIECLHAQLEIATEVDKPVFLHQRDAHTDMLAVLREFRPHLKRAVVHCFTGTGDELDDYLALDMYIGITGWICDERRGQHLRDLVGRIPADRLLIETDAPYLLPRDLPAEQRRSLPDRRRNEPCILPHVFRAVAACRDESAERAREQIWRNSLAFFAES